MSGRNEDLDNYFLDGEKVNKHYCRTIAWFLSHAHHFSLACRDGVDWDLRACNLLEELEPFLLTKVRQNWWPGVYLKDTVATIYKYRCEEGMAPMLTKHVTGFDEWAPPRMPEDLVFYRENDFWMFVHRPLCSVMLSSQEHNAFEQDFPGFLTPYSEVE